MVGQEFSSEAGRSRREVQGNRNEEEERGGGGAGEAKEENKISVQCVLSEEPQQHSSGGAMTTPDALWEVECTNMGRTSENQEGNQLLRRLTSGRSLAGPRARLGSILRRTIDDHEAASTMTRS